MKYAALLRGINVGGRIIKSAELKDCFASLGLTNVKTVLQTGNVVFESDEPAEKLKNNIENILSETFNFPAKVWVLPVDIISDIIDANPIRDAPADYHQYIIFFADSLEKDFAAEAETVSDSNEEVMAGHGVVYWKVPKGRTLKSPVGKLLARTRYKDSTNRNANTLRKIAAAS